MPLPCSASYIIRVFLKDTGDNTNFNYAVKLIVEHSSDKNVYNDTYIVKHVSGQNYVDFNFDGKTDKMCTYYASTDVVCLTSPNICYSKSMNSIYTGKLCTSKITFTAPCPAPTTQKRYHDVKTEALPLHINFGIFKNIESFSNDLSLSFGSQLYRLTNDKIPSYSIGRVTYEAHRYAYVWKIEPFNFLVSVILNNTDIPIRVGFNQSFTSSLLGINSPCAGNSTCYTNMPYCGDGVCDTAAGENCLTCKADCGCSSDTLGCYGVPNVQGFTDAHGCIYRYKQYEENCTFNDECDSSKGLYCDFHEVHGKMSQVGHCCKQGEIWDPTTPIGFQDANSSIKGTCRVPRGVKIDYITTSFDGNDVIHTCSQCSWGLGKLEYASRYKVEVTVSTPNPLGENICVLFATEPDYCCCDGTVNNYGGGWVKCAKVYGSHTFTFHISERAPYEEIVFGHSLGMHRYCSEGSKMMVLAWIPINFTSDNETYRDWAVNGTYWTNFWSKLYFVSGSSDTYLNNYGFYYSSKSGKLINIDYTSTGDKNVYVSVDAKYQGDNSRSSSSEYESSDILNGHPGNIFENANEEYDWADLVFIGSTSTSSCNDLNSAGEYVSSTEEYIPYGSKDFTNYNMKYFMCGGHTAW